MQQTIKSITQQDMDLSLIEVIVVTQNDRLNDEILDLKQHVALSVYPRPATESISSLRNHGAEKASSEYLAFIDADICLSPDWSRRMLDELNQEDSNRVLVSAIQKNSQQANSVERIRTVLNNISKDSNVDSLHGSNLFIKAETFKLSGGFPEDLQTCEDVFFTNKVSSFGLLFLSSRADFIHLGEDKSYKDMFKKEIWRGLSNLQSFHGRNVPLRELPSIFIPVILMILFISSTFLFVFDFIIPAVFLLLAMLTPVIAYTIRLRKYCNNQNIRSINLLSFYFIYFIARSIGSYKGLYKALLKT